MAILWLDSAVDDLERIDLWLSSIEGADPDKVRALIGSAISNLDRLGDIGRPGRRPGIRELSIRKAPYVIVYRLRGDDIELVQIFHTSQKR